MSRTESFTSCRLLVDAAGPGAWQMAVDEALLESAADRPGCTLRFYQWSRPTLSLGYFQRCAQRARHAASRDCDLVRRQTGGGAILHDRELTYSFVLPAAHPLARDTARLHVAIHEALAAVLEQYGLRARLCDAPSGLSPEDEPFLCFQRRAAGDLLLDDTKICGSAQRRRRGAILQHGSLLLARSTAAPELPGILEQGGRRLEVAELIERASGEIARRLRLILESQEISAVERGFAAGAATRKYGSPDWNFKR